MTFAPARNDRAAGHWTRSTETGRRLGSGGAVGFRNRTEAGIRLGQALERFRGPDVVVLGLPRGGVPVAFEVAVALGAPLDVILVRKLGVPFQRELAMGAIGEDGVRVLNDEVCRWRRSPPRRSTGSRRPSGSSCSAGRSCSALASPDSTSTGGPPSSSTTGWPPARRRGPPAWSPGPTGRPGSCSPSPVAPEDTARRFAGVVDEFVAVSTPAASWPWASPTTTSPRSPTTRSSTCWSGPAPTPPAGGAHRPSVSRAQLVMPPRPTRPRASSISPMWRRPCW